MKAFFFQFPEIDDLHKNWKNYFFNNFEYFKFKYILIFFQKGSLGTTYGQKKLKD